MKQCKCVFLPQQKAMVWPFVTKQALTIEEIVKGYPTHWIIENYDCHACKLVIICNLQ